MGAALDDAGGGDKGQLCFLLELSDRQRTAVAHRRTDLAERQRNIVLQRAGIGYIGIDAFFKGELRIAAEIIALPVSGSGRCRNWTGSAYLYI